MEETTVSIPNRAAFRAQEVCELADLQPYVLRSWESEFPDLGVAKAAGGPRVYRRADVERVLRIKHLIFSEGLTLAGVRRLLTSEGDAASDTAIEDADVAALVDHETRQHLYDVRRGLQWILGVLGGSKADAAGDVTHADRVAVSTDRESARAEQSASRGNLDARATGQNGRPTESRRSGASSAVASRAKPSRGAARTASSVKPTKPSRSAKTTARAKKR